MTNEQQRASDPAYSVWVSANAGTGKTKILCDRVLRLLLDGNAPSRILCLTYTKAAAAEMKNRIHAQLGRWVSMDDAALRASLEALTGAEAGLGLLKRARMLFAAVLDAPEGVRIDTIHAFCQSLLRRFPLEAGTQPHFTVIDEQTSAELLLEAKQRLYQHSAGGDPALDRAVTYIAGRLSEHGFLSLLSSILAERRTITRAMREAGGLNRYLAALQLRYGIERDTDMDSIGAAFFARSRSRHAELSEMAAALLKGSANEKKLGALLAEWLANASPDGESAMRYAAAYVTQKGTPREKLVTKGFAEAHSAYSPILSAEIEAACAFTQAVQSLELVQAAEALAHVADGLFEFYRRLKQTRAALDYDDLIIAARDLLQKPGIAPWILYKLDGGLDHLLVDEAQDTSIEQWQIVEALVSDFFSGQSRSERQRTFFVVGDEKQSIYRFQEAEPRAFAFMHRRFAEAVAASGESLRTVRLDISFRSTETVLNAVDRVFARDAARRGLTFSDEEIRHTAHRQNVAGSVEVWPLIESEETEATTPWPMPMRTQTQRRPALQLAERIAATLKGWFDGNRMLAARGRPVTPGDVIILMRSRNELVGYLVRALRRRGIPVAGVDRLRITGHIAVMDMMALAEFLLLPQDDLTLAALLKSPLFALNEEELFTLAYGRGKATLWNRLQGTYDSSAITEAAKYLKELLAITDYVTPYALFGRVLEIDSGRSKFIGRMGEEAGDALDEFLSLALDYGNTHIPSLQGFLHWLRQSDIEIKRDLEHGKGEVRILTVHGAKGLQAPVVILPDTVSTGGRDGGQMLYWDEAGDIPFLLWPIGAASAHPRLEEIREETKRKDEEEYRRLLYVAMTRAEDELIVAGFSGKRRDSKEHWYSLVFEGLKDQAQQIPLSWSGKEAIMLRMEEGTPARVAEPAAARSTPAAETVLPAFVHSPPPPEPLQLASLVLSDISEEPDTHFLSESHTRAKGTYSQRLFQLLSGTIPERRRDSAFKYLDRFATELSPEARHRLAEEVITIMHDPHFAPVFSADALAEVPVCGVLKKGTASLLLSGQIDRLAVTKKEVFIVNFKRGALQASGTAPASSLRQLAAYREAMRQIYPGKKISCAFLWTAIPLLMPVPDHLLEEKTLHAS